MKKWLIVILSIVIIIISYLSVNPVKTTLLLLQAFPTIPLKPLNYYPNPAEHVDYIINKEKIIRVDLFKPQGAKKSPSIILATGIKLQKKDEDGVIEAARNLSKLGYVVLWPRDNNLINGTVLIESPQTFSESIKYLKNQKYVDPGRISIIGFSSGASIAMVTAEDPSVKDKIKSFTFFGGFFNIIDYLNSVATQKYRINGADFLWDQDKNLQGKTREVVKNQNMTRLLIGIDKKVKIDPYLTPAEEKKLKKISPDTNIQFFETPIFIIHDKKDRTVPYSESIKLNQQLKGVKKEILITNGFDHVTPDNINISEGLKMFFFFNKILSSF